MRHAARILCALVILARPASAQTIENVGASEPTLLSHVLENKSLFAQPADPHASERLCAGCPPRSVGRALWQTTVINVFYGIANLVRGQVTARVTPTTWWANMEQGWVWDLDDFVVNQIGHPYQGSNYYNSGRANGLSFYESAAMAAFGSSTWEFFGETNHASLNDFINTTLGGIAWGEVLHRAAWLVRDTHKSGKGRMWNEIGATILDPVSGYNRFRTGDAARAGDKPAEMVPSSLGAMASTGVLWRGTEHEPFKAAGKPFFEADLLYGESDAGRSRDPYDAFFMQLRFGGGGPLSDAKLVGRLLGQPMRNGELQFNILQAYDYQNNEAYSFGAQSFSGSLGFTHQLSQRFSLSMNGSAGLTVLGAIDSLPLDVEEKPIDEPESSAGQGVSEGPRYYDYGPGGNFSGRITLTGRKERLATIFYEGRHIYSLDGVRANHFLQHVRLDVRAPIKGPLGIGATGEYFSRHTYFQDAAKTERLFRFPQFRAYLTWTVS